jgi:hypothetical protein
VLCNEKKENKHILFYSILFYIINAKAYGVEVMGEMEVEGCRNAGTEEEAFVKGGNGGVWGE